MAIEFKIGQRPEELGVGMSGLSAANVGETQDGAKAESAKQLLGGKSVRVTSGAMTDLEKLVAQLKSETDDTRQSVSQKRISILMTVLNSMADRVTERQKNAFVELEDLCSKLSDIERDISGWTAEKASAAQKSAELDIMIKSLENAVDNALQDGEDHRKQVEKLKAQKANLDEKIRQLENAISSAKTKASGIQASISQCSEAIGAATLSEVSAAVRMAVSEEKGLPERAETQSDRDKQAKKEEETSIANSIHESLERIDAEMSKTVEGNREIKA